MKTVSRKCYSVSKFPFYRNKTSQKYTSHFYSLTTIPHKHLPKKRKYVSTADLYSSLNKTKSRFNTVCLIKPWFYSACLPIISLPPPISLYFTNIYHGICKNHVAGCLQDFISLKWRLPT